MNSGAVLPLARFYGWTVISEHDAFFHAFNTEELNPQHLKFDGVHPHGKAVALYGDLVLAAMWAAHEGWRAWAARRCRAARRVDAPTAAGAAGRAGGRGAQPRVLHIRPAALHRRARERLGEPHRRCRGRARAGHRTQHGVKFIANESRSARANKPGLQATAAGVEPELRVLPVTTTVAGRRRTSARRARQRDRGGGTSPRTRAWAPPSCAAPTAAAAPRAR